MKKINLLLPLVFLIGCAPVDETTINIFAPNGTPSLALANYYEDYKDSYNIFDLGAGPDAVTAAFANLENKYDVILAPTNIGATFYNKTKKYLLYQTIVWGNLYIASTEKITSFSDLENQTIIMYGENATPGIVVKILISHHQLKNITLDFTGSDDETVGSLLLANKAKYVVIAEPSLSKIKKQNPDLNVLDLQNEWKNLTGSTSYPQASIFVKASLKGKIDNQLQKITKSVLDTIANPQKTALKAVKMSSTFNELGTEILTSAIPNCHYEINEKQKEAIDYYFNVLNDLGKSAMYGGTIPNEDFYY